MLDQVHGRLAVSPPTPKGVNGPVSAAVANLFELGFHHAGATCWISPQGTRIDLKLDDEEGSPLDMEQSL